MPLLIATGRGRTFANTTPAGSGGSSAIGRFQSWITYTTAGILSRAPRPPPVRTSLHKAVPRSILNIAGRYEITAGRYFKSGSPTNVRLVEMQDTAHASGLRTHPSEWENSVIQFLALNL